MMTVEYRGNIVEIPLNVWNLAEKNGDKALDVLGEGPDIVLDEIRFQKLKETAAHSKLGARILRDL